MLTKSPSEHTQVPICIWVFEVSQHVFNKPMFQFGFPYKNTFSPEAYTAAFLVVQHSSNASLIEKVIKIFSEANNSQINKPDMVYLIDRSRVLQNLLQIYGTQYKILEDGKIGLFPIENPEGVDERRKEMEMESLENYISDTKGI